MLFFVILVIGESFYTFNEHIKRFPNEKNSLFVEKWCYNKVDYKVVVDTIKWLNRVWNWFYLEFFRYWKYVV